MNGIDQSIWVIKKKKKKYFEFFGGPFYDVLGGIFNVIIFLKYLFNILQH